MIPSAFRLRSMPDDPPLASPICPAGRGPGFSLLELLLVVGVMGILAVLLIPAASGFASSANRRGAVDILMSALEQARVAAIESRQLVYIGFADADFPVEDMRFAAWIVFREASEEETASDPAKRFVVLQKWTRLPKNMAFLAVGGTLVGGAPTGFPGLGSEVGAAHADEAFPILAFNATGAVDQPTSPLRMLLYEGYFAGGRDNPLTSRASPDANRFEQISLSRFTGRAQFDLAAAGN